MPVRSAASAEQDTPSGSNGEHSFRPARLGQHSSGWDQSGMRLHTFPLINFNSREQDKIPIYNFCWCKYYHLHYNWSIPFGVQGTGTKWNLNCTLKTSKTRYKHVSILCGFPSITTSCSSSFLLNNTFRKEIKMLCIYPHKNYKYK